MTTTYPLGYTEAEHGRLIRQAKRIARMTERFLLDAGIDVGQRVLELGSGLGDVSMLIAGLVGLSGEVIGVERDADSIAKARVRVAEAGWSNVRYCHADVNAVVDEQRFDAVVGRYVLQWLPDPAATLRRCVALLRPGGVVAFQEVSWATHFAYVDSLPFVKQCMQATRETLRQRGANTDMGFDLYRVFQDAGLPAPAMRLEVTLGGDASAARAIADVVRSVRPDTSALGDLDTLDERILREVQAARTVLTMVPTVSAWTVRP